MNNVPPDKQAESAGQPESADQREVRPRSVVIEIAPAMFNLTCYGFHVWAEDFLAAEKLYAPMARRGSYVPQFLCCQSIELSLKAFLSLKGFTRTKLRRDFGHNLVRLYGEAVDKGIGTFVTLQSGDGDVVATANKAYDSRTRKKLQYFDVHDAVTAFKSLPELPALENLANRLQAEALRDALLKG
jgi:hypothetical protein